ncbi:MAG: hypothetical protein ACRDP3_08555 [Streptomyces sp.]|uniref:hypothetical protein n=1 Tax=Streptomyces sp. TaxID=1931 RepID=UPI003D6AB514
MPPPTEPPNTRNTPHDLRARVVLYACVHDATDPARIMGSLRELAAARDWEVVDSVYDTGPLDRPLTDRLGWRTVDALVRDHRAQGVVALSPRHLPYLRTRLPYRAAFVAYLEQGRP